MIQVILGLIACGIIVWGPFILFAWIWEKIWEG